jgi:hypothetical protein
MLTWALGGDPRTITWLSASPSDAGVTLRLHHVLDDGSEKFFDVYEFRSVDEDDYLGEGRVVGVYPVAAAALEAAVEFGARIDRWANQGVVQDEYETFGYRSRPRHLVATPADPRVHYLRHERMSWREPKPCFTETSLRRCQFGGAAWSSWGTGCGVSHPVWGIRVVVSPVRRMSRPRSSSVAPSWEARTGARLRSRGIRRSVAGAVPTAAGRRSRRGFRRVVVTR